MSGPSIDDALGEDHETLGGVLDSLIAAIPKSVDTASSLLAVFRKGLDRHMKWEEADLFPAVRAHATEKEKRSIESLEIDHERIRETLNDLAAGLESGDAPRAGELADLVRTYLQGHNYDEEHGVYEEADRYLDDAERERLLARFGPNPS